MNHHTTHETTDTLGEYWADGIIHILGVTASIVASVLLAYFAFTQASNLVAYPLLAYSFGLVATFIFSAAYNMTITPGPKALLRKFDRAAIFVMIAGTYTPLGLLGIGGSWGPYLVTANWLLAICGVMATLFFSRKFERFSLALYLFQGGLMIIALKPMFDALSAFAFTMILLGALTYATGVIFYRRDDWKFNRAIWHIFVLSAAAIHYLAILDIANFA